MQQWLWVRSVSKQKFAWQLTKVRTGGEDNHFVIDLKAMKSVTVNGEVRRNIITGFTLLTSGNIASNDWRRCSLRRCRCRPKCSRPCHGQWSVPIRVSQPLGGRPR